MGCTCSPDAGSQDVLGLVPGAAEWSVEIPEENNSLCAGGPQSPNPKSQTLSLRDTVRVSHRKGFPCSPDDASQDCLRDSSQDQGLISLPAVTLT